MKFLMCLILTGFLLSPAFANVNHSPLEKIVSEAGNATGNGGDGIWLPDGNLYLFDLYEAQIIGLLDLNNLDFAETTATNPVILMHVNRILGDLGEVNEVFARKLSQLNKIDSGAVFGVLKVFEKFESRFSSGKLRDIPDDGDSVVLSDQKLEQLAVRYNTRIIFNKTLWNAMSVGQRVALLFHEGIYALLNPRESGSGSAGYQSAGDAREITAYLFSRDFERKGLSSWRKLIEFPYEKLRTKSWSSYAIGNGLYRENIFKKNTPELSNKQRLSTSFFGSYIETHEPGNRNSTYIARLAIQKDLNKNQVYQLIFNQLKESIDNFYNFKSYCENKILNISTIVKVFEIHEASFEQKGKEDRRFMTLALRRESDSEKILDDPDFETNCVTNVEEIAKTATEVIYNQMQKAKP